MVVAEKGDEVAQALAEEVCRSWAVRPLIYSLPQASRMFSISVSGDGSYSVEPDLPLFLRAPQQRRWRRSFRGRVHLAEHAGVLWTAASLTSSPCINRPTSRGFTLASTSAAITELRSGLAAEATAPELFSSALPDEDIYDPQGVPLSQWCSQDMATGDVARAPHNPRGCGPYRTRQREPGTCYETVVVVGNEAWRTSTIDLGNLGLESRSGEAATKLGVTFAAIVWAVDREYAAAVPARIDLYPKYHQVAPVWSEVSAALLRILAR